MMCRNLTGFARVGCWLASLFVFMGLIPPPAFRLLQPNLSPTIIFRILYLQLSPQWVDNANRTVGLPFSQVFRVKDRSAGVPGSLNY